MTIKKAKRKLPLHDYSIVKATVPCLLRYATLFLPHMVCCFPPVCLNVVFLSLPPSQAALFRSLSEKRGRRKIISHPAGHSVVTGVWATKKAGTSMCTDQYKRIDLSLAVLVSQWCNRLWDSKSKLSVTLICCRQFEAVSEATVFPFRIPQACTA